MASSWRVSTASSSSPSCSRPRWAIHRTCSGVSVAWDTANFPGSYVRLDRERLPLDRPLDPPAADTLDAHPLAHHRAALLALQRLQVGLECPPADARHLAADAAEVLRLTPAA